MCSDWFNGIEILQGRWQHGEKVGYCYPSGLEKTLCKWDIYILLVTKGLKSMHVDSQEKERTRSYRGMRIAVRFYLTVFHFQPQRTPARNRKPSVLSVLMCTL